MQGLIIINAYPAGEKFYHQANRLAEELRLLNIEVDILRNGEVYALLDKQGELQIPALKKYDFVVYLDKDKYLGRMLEWAGLKLFNTPKAVEICDDKMLTYLALQGAGICLAKTIPAPLCYTKDAKADESFLEKVAKELGFPLVVKKSFGSFGVGVQLVHGMPELKKVAQEFLYEPHFFQEYISQSQGRDIRVMVVGGKTVAAMERVAQKGEFRSNIELGGEGRQINLPPIYAETAEKAAKALGLEYCGVDLLQTKDGPILCEVNSNAFFEGLEKTTGCNVAAAYAKRILECIK